MKLSICDLNFVGGLVPEDKESLKDMILTTFNNCVAEGAENLQLPDQPLSYSSLIQVLKDKGLLKSSCSTPSSSRASPPPSQSTEDIDILALGYKQEVNSLKKNYSCMTLLLDQEYTKQGSLRGHL